MRVKLKADFFDGKQLFRREPGGTEFPDLYDRDKLPSSAEVVEETEPEQEELDLSGNKAKGADKEKGSSLLKDDAKAEKGK